MEGSLSRLECGRMKYYLVIGNVTSIKFWVDRWPTQIDTLSEHALVPILDYMLTETMSNFVNFEGC